MIAWINFSILIISSVLFTLFYVKSVGPAALAAKIGDTAYKKCAVYRAVSSIFMAIASLNYIVYHLFPLPLALPTTFSWPWWVSVVIAACIGIPGMYLMLVGVRDAGEETMRPKQEHAMYSGIYQKIRHPQALGEFPLWWMLAFLVHSPFLVLFSFLYIPVWCYFCVAEEKDLILRFGADYEAYRQRVGFWFPKRPQ